MTVTTASPCLVRRIFVGRGGPGDDQRLTFTRSTG
jgi:hypothetical protein